jgi:cyclopropane-fatty-acyl-phospholipid synthase
MLVEAFFTRLIRCGRLTVHYADGRSEVYGGEPGPNVTIRLHNTAVGRRIACNPSLGAAESYMDGLLSVENGELYDFLDIAALNIGLGHLPRLYTCFKHLGLWTRRFMQHNSPLRARRNVAHHYDLSDALYELFLDPQRQYSCAYFAEPGLDLEEAQRAKMQLIVDKLLLAPGQKVLDIGCGWGGLAAYLASQGTVRVRGLTLSNEQHRYAQVAARKAGLDDRLSFALEDYRHDKGLYDRIVSVGMFEHVGINYYDEYFAKLKDLLSADGVALLHTIGRTDGPSITDSFIRKYIFPGGYIPALSEVVTAIERSGLIITDIEVLRLHYADTLRAWRKNFLANRERAMELYDDKFCRMWEFYLGGSETSFRHLGMVVYQIQLTRRQDTVPLTRAYLHNGQRRSNDHGIAAR